MDTARIRPATLDDAPAVRQIYAHYIASSITFEEELPSEQEFQGRVKDVLECYPFLVAERDDSVIGYAYAHEFAERAAYRWNVELSIYLAPKAGRHGLGTELYQTLLSLLKLQGFRKAYARVTLPNAASKRLHEKLGFHLEWKQKRAGWKAGRWHDVAWYSKALAPQNEKDGETPLNPPSTTEISPEQVTAILDRANEALARNAKTHHVSGTTRKCMQGNKGANTKPELEVRKILRKLGQPGYRLQWKQCPGKPDIAYPGRKLAIFVNGCFWHRCPECKLPAPQSNVEYWEAKFRRNVERDQENRAAAEAAGWTVITIWEHDLKPERRDDTERYLYEYVCLPE